MTADWLFLPVPAFQWVNPRASQTSDPWRAGSPKARGSTLAPGEPVDQFLGRLHQNGTNVHELAANELSGDDLAPTELHIDLLRLYPNEGSVRIVTTNFDLLFELAAESLSLRIPEVYRGPALLWGMTSPASFTFTEP